MNKKLLAVAVAAVSIAALNLIPRSAQSGPQRAPQALVGERRLRAAAMAGRGAPLRDRGRDHGAF
jgi:hypothetical protein